MLARQTLLDVFAQEDADRDVGWAVADTFTLLEPHWVSTNVIEPRLHQFVDPRVPYLIGRLGMAAEGSPQRDYLEQCLVHGIPAVQARALRALGALRADAKRPLCESVVAADWAEVRRQGINLPLEITEEDRERTAIACRTRRWRVCARSAMPSRSRPCGRRASRRLA